MASYVVAYDLHQFGQNYQCLTTRLKAYGTHWHVQQSVWIVITNQSAAQVRDNLQSCLDSNDKLFVARLTGEAAWFGYAANINQWLKTYLPR